MSGNNVELQVKISALLISALFPSILLGFSGLLVFGLFGALFGMVNASAPVSAAQIPTFFAQFGTLGFTGFVFGFAGYMGIAFERAFAWVTPWHYIAVPAQQVAPPATPQPPQPPSS